MKLIPFRRGGVAALFAVSIMLSACGTGSILESDTVDYKSARQGSRLDVPPDLTKLQQNENFQVPGGAVDFSTYMQGTETPTVAGLSNSVGDVTMKRDGDRRWLLVERSPEKIWGTLEAFWQDLGFVLVVDEPRLGLLETDWAENRANIPQDFIRRSLGKVFDSVYSTGERDKFRLRVEVSAEGTEVYITHRGVEEVYNDQQKVTTVWQPRPTSPDLEAEMLRRLMVRLGASQEQSRAAIAQAGDALGRTQMLTRDGSPELELNEAFDDAWRWVGISLDRISFTVVDRDRQAGIYHVRYIDPVVDTVANEPGLLRGLFGGKKAGNPADDLQIKLNPSGARTLIQVLSKDGGAADPQVATRILNALAKDLH
ncbi:MAG: outer membrane protein assembly factor BamC [Saezia sp.]